MASAGEGKYKLPMEQYILVTTFTKPKKNFRMFIVSSRSTVHRIGRTERNLYIQSVVVCKLINITGFLTHQNYMRKRNFVLLDD